VARRSSPARLVIALAVAAMLAVFLLYTSIAGGGTPQVPPSELRGRTSEVGLVGKVVGPVQRSGRTIRFRVKDIEGTSSVRLPVTYTGSVPDLFRADRDISLKGQLRNGTFVGKSGTLITKCPSKYTASKES
jgi:cytochrome c-type biogenesis protein CcmE